MVRRELAVSMTAIERINKHVQGDGNLEAWVQSKITRATDYLDTVADYMDSGVSESLDVPHEEVNEGAAGPKNQERKSLEVLTRKEENLTREKILEATLRHHQRRLEIPVAHPFALE